MDPLPQIVWLERCVTRITEVERDMGENEARRLARDMQNFERTRAMAPEAAVDFVAAELARPSGVRFERRLQSRD